jgi:hypothetical protein
MIKAGGRLIALPRQVRFSPGHPSPVAEYWKGGVNFRLIPDDRCGGRPSPGETWNIGNVRFIPAQGKIPTFAVECIDRVNNVLPHVLGHRLLHVRRDLEIKLERVTRRKRQMVRQMLKATHRMFGFRGGASAQRTPVRRSADFGRADDRPPVRQKQRRNRQPRQDHSASPSRRAERQRRRKLHRVRRDRNQNPHTGRKK